MRSIWMLKATKRISWYGTLARDRNVLGVSGI